jgi:LuxR family maltose regulon positive regulatory protein
MEEAISPLVLTKLRVPAARGRFVSRTRLIDFLAVENGASFILVCAPAGYGKTSLLAEWAQFLVKKGTAVAWYALDPGDDDPIPFRSYLIASFIQALGPITELTQIAQLLRTSPEIDLQRILPAIINAIVLGDRKCVLILDDYQLIANPAIHSALAYLLEHLPEKLRIAIGSRSDPPLPLARLRAHGQLVEIRTGDLRFTRHETVQFLSEVMRLELSLQEIHTLEERTEGWVAGLQLAGLSLSDRTLKEQVIGTFSGDHRYLVEYLMQEVVDHQPEEVQLFLLSTAILERMCAPLCDAILGTTQSSEAILKQLEQANLFVVALDDQSQWYRYHHLFRDFLLARLNKIRPEGIHILHRAACEWLAAHGFLREAAGHAFQTHDWEYTAQFVEQHSFTLIIHSEISTIYEWCSAFPEQVMQRHPMLCLQQSLSLAYGFRRQNRERVEARLRQAEQMIAAFEDPGAARGLSDLAAVVRTFLAFAPDPAADPQELLDLAQNMLRAYSQRDPARFSGLLLAGYAYMALQDAQSAEHAFETARQIALGEGLYFGIAESTFHLARLAHSQGQLQRAAQICHQGRADIVAELAHPEQELPALGCLDVALGCVQLEQNQLDEAEQNLCRGLDLMGGGMNPYYQMTAYIALFRLYVILGQLEEATKYLKRLESIWPDIDFCTRGLGALHSLRTMPDDPIARSEAATWSQEFFLSVDEGETPGLGPFGAGEAYYLAYLAWAEIQIALGNPQVALAYLDKQFERVATNGLKNRAIELSMLQALGWQAQGAHDRAVASLEQAISIAMPEGYIRTFDQGPFLAQLLIEAAQRGSYQEYAKRILNSIGNTETPVSRSAQIPFAQSLSERELEVLQLIAQGATNQEIAERLVITVGTVKSHINHILGKLDAHNRTEAVARARSLGLLGI